MILVVLFTSTSYGAYWELSNKYGSTSVFKSKNKTRLTINHKSTINKDKKITKKLINKIKSTKIKMLSMLGIKKWKASKTLLRKVRPGLTELVLKGSYLNQSNTKVYFVEKHYFKNESLIQMLFTNTNIKSLVKGSSKKNNVGFEIKYGL